MTVLFVDRLFVRLKEMTMLGQPSPISANTREFDEGHLPSAEDHYRAAWRFLQESEKAGTPFADVNAFQLMARGRLHAAEVATRIWPSGGGEDPS